MTALQGQPLPAEDPNSEQFVLSAALHGGEGLTEARRLSTLDFQPGPNQHVHRAILALDARGLDVNPDTVRDELQRTGYPQAGPYLLKLYGYHIPGPSAGAYADRVVAAAADRRMLEAGQRLVQLTGAEPSDSRTLAMLGELETYKAALEGARPSNGRALHAVAAAGRRMRAARWLMNLRIPLGAITLLAGREGIGKSTTSYDIIAELTTGRLAGEYYGTPKGVGIVATEDAWEEVILPRLFAAGAALDRVYQLDARTAEGYSTTLSVPGDLDRLTTLCVTHEIALIVLDPIMSVMPSGIDTHKDREVRTALEPLAQFCITTGVAVLALIHVNKSNGSDPLNSIMASKGFTNVARSVLYCIVDPECEREDRYLFGHIKSNLGPKQPSVAYRITQVTIEVPSDQPGVLDAITTSRVQWDGEDQRTIASLLEPKPRERADGELAQRLTEWITQQPAAVSSGEVVAEFSDVSRATLDKTLSRLVKRGKLGRPFHGHYAPPQREESS